MAAIVHVLVVGHASLAVGPVLEGRLLHDGAQGEEGGRWNRNKRISFGFYF